MKQKYIDECKVIQQNCTYTAEAHHQIAISEKRKAFWLEVVPAVCAAVSSALVAAKVICPGFIFLTIVSSVMTAVCAVINPAKNYQAHLDAAKNFTAMKHDARFMHEVMSLKLNDEAFGVAVENLHNQYNDLIRNVPPTTPGAFAKAQKIVQAHVHEPDRDGSGKIQ